MPGRLLFRSIMQHIRYTTTPHSDRNDWRNIRRMVPVLWQYRRRVALALSCLILAKVANVAVPLVLRDVVDALDRSSLNGLALPVVLLLGYGSLRLASSLFNELRDAVFARVRYGAMRRISTRVLGQLQGLSLRYHLERRTGAVTRDLERGTRSLSNILNYLVFNILPAGAELILVAIILLSHYSFLFTLVTLSTVVVYVAFTFAVTEWRMHYRHRMNALESEANMQAVDSLINYETVKSFGNEPLEVHRYEHTLTDWEEAAVRSQTSMSVLNFGQGAIIAVGVTVIMFLAADGVATGTMSLGDLVMVNAYLLQLFLPLNLLGIVYRQMKYSLADMDLMVRLLDREPEIRDLPGAQKLRLERGRVCFEHVGFHYSADRRILENVDFCIEPQHKVAVVGPSGAGKSTVVRLLLRFYDVSQGRVSIDGVDIREVTQKSLREQIGIVPQDTLLFNDTILYNIRYAKPEATVEDTVQAAQMAHIHDFIGSLPKGYDTVVGERGLKLSGGEKQRVAIARAILKRPRILVFDEATSSLDSRTELAIQETLRELSAHHTTLVIAHRLSTIVDADLILVLDRGRIVERGDHRQLLGKQGLYWRMWLLQQEKRDMGEMDGELAAATGQALPRVG
jgi:ABC-type transport system involved in Fe-S cluster assembly fused permease/ATPase subunit